MGSDVVKIEPDLNLYFVYSTITEDFVFVGKRKKLIKYLYKREDRKPDRIPNGQKPEDRVARADAVGNSSRWDPDPFDNTKGRIFRQEGVLYRKNYRAMAELLLSSDEPWDADVSHLLEPFD